MDSTKMPCGWYKDVNAVRDNLQTWASRGLPINATQYSEREMPSLKGNWERLKKKGVLGVFFSDAQKTLLGNYRRPFLQHRGTCVDRGVTGAVQCSLDVSIVEKASSLRKADIQFGTTYIGARVNVGKNRIRGEGAILGHAMTAIHDIGVMEVGSVSSFNGKTEAQVEEMIVDMSYSPLPLEWVRAMEGRTCSTFWCEDCSWIFDCLSAGFGVPYAFEYVTGMPNKKGIAGIGEYGPHCRFFSGCYVDDTGRDRLISRESWGAFPAEPANYSDHTREIDSFARVSIFLGDGSKKTLGPGEVAVDASAFTTGIYQGGEVYAVGCPSGFTADSLASLLQSNTQNKGV